MNYNEAGAMIAQEHALRLHKEALTWAVGTGKLPGTCPGHFMHLLVEAKERVEVMQGWLHRREPAGTFKREFDGGSVYLNPVGNGPVRYTHMRLSRVGMLQDFWRCKHHPSAIDNYYDRSNMGCAHGCDTNELRWHDNGCKQAT